MSSVPPPGGVNIAVFWAFAGLICLELLGIRLFIPRRRQRRASRRHRSRAERIHAYRRYRSIHRKRVYRRWIGLLLMLSGAIGIFLCIRFWVESSL